MITVETIIQRLNEATKGSASEIYTDERLARFAKFYIPHWDENTDPDVIAESFVDDVWDSPSQCRRCSVCGRLMTEGYYEEGGLDYFGDPNGGYYCSDECLHEVYPEHVAAQMSQNDEIFYTEWY